VAEVTYDGEFYKDVIRVEGDAATEEWNSGVLQAAKEAAEAVPTGCEEADVTYNEDLADVVCRWSPVARRNFPTAVLDQQVYLFGGYRSKDDFGHDVWYRDEHKPTTFITVKPDDESSDTVIDFACDEPGCLFEYVPLGALAVVLPWVMLPGGC